MCQFRVQLWLDEWWPEPDIDEVIEAVSPRKAVVTLCRQQAIQQATWVQVDEVIQSGKWLSVCFLDVEVKGGRLSYEQRYGS